MPLVYYYPPNAGTTQVEPSTQKHNNRRCPDRRILPRKCQLPGFPVNPETGNCIAPLVARIKKPASRIDVEAARVIASRPLLANVSQRALRSDREKRNAVVQAVRRI